MPNDKKTKQLTVSIELLDAESGRKVTLPFEPSDLSDEQFSKFIKLAIESRDKPFVRKLLEARPNLHPWFGAQLLWKVIDDADTEIAEMMVRAGADLNQSFDEDSFSFLHVLAKSDSQSKRELALLMMDHGADLTAEDLDGCCACRVAMKHGNLAFAQELLKRGVAVEKTLLWEAACSPTPVESVLLLVNGDHVKDAKTRSQLVASAFYDLCQFNLDDDAILDMVKALFDPEILPATSFSVAVACGLFKVVEWLLGRTDVDKTEKMTFLHDAVGLDESTMARMLIEWGADINYRDPTPFTILRCIEEGSTPLHVAVGPACMCLWPSYQNVRLLLHLGADVNILDDEGRTPFSRLLRSHRPAPENEQLTDTSRLFVKHLAMLLSKGALVNVDDLELIDSRPVVQGFFDECLAELQAMKEMEISVGITFHSIFNKSIQELSLLIRRQTFVEGYDNHLNSFPVYREDLNLRVGEAERRKNLLVLKEEALYESTGEIMPDISLEKIVRYLCLSEDETLADKLGMLDS